MPKLTSASKKKVLIIDDEPGIRESLKLILGDIYNLILTDSGPQALECLANSKDIGLVLVDIKMPQVNGLDVLKAVKKDHPGVPVIVVTGYKSVETASEAAKLGADGYIPKPFKSEEILETVKRHFK